MKFLEYLKVKSEKNRDEREKKEDLGRKVWREVGQISEKRIRLKKKFKCTRKRSGENIQEEKEDLELRKRRRKNGRRKRLKGRRSGELVERKEVSRRLRP